MNRKEVTNPKGVVFYNVGNCMSCGIYDIFWFIFSMVYTRGFGSGVGGPKRPELTHDDIHKLIATEVAAAIRVPSWRFLGLSRPQ